VFIEILLSIIEEKRYLDNDNLTPEQEAELQKIPGMMVEEYGSGQRTYTIYGSYK
jgi:hypothetical protein